MYSLCVFITCTGYLFIFLSGLTIVLCTTTVSVMGTPATKQINSNTHLSLVDSGRSSSMTNAPNRSNPIKAQNIIINVKKVIVVSLAR